MLDYNDFEQFYQTDNIIDDSTIEHLYNFLSINPNILVLFIEYLSNNEDNNGSAGDIENFLKSIARLNSKVFLARILETLQKLILNNQLDKKILNKLNKVFSNLGIDIYNLDLNKFINEFKENINKNEKITEARRNIEEINNKNKIKNINVISNNLEIIKGIRRAAKLETEKLNKTTKNILKSSNKMLGNNKLNANKLFGILSSIKKTLGIGAIGGVAGGLKADALKASTLRAGISKSGALKAGGIGGKIGNLKKGMEGAALKGGIGLGSGKAEAKLDSQLNTKGKMEEKKEEKIEKREKSQEVVGSTKNNNTTINNSNKEKPVENNRNVINNNSTINNSADKSKNGSISRNSSNSLNGNLSKKQNNIGVGDDAKLLGSIIKNAFKEVNKEKSENKTDEKPEKKLNEKPEEKPKKETGGEPKGISEEKDDELLDSLFEDEPAVSSKPGKAIVDRFNIDKSSHISTSMQRGI